MPPQTHINSESCAKVVDRIGTAGSLPGAQRERLGLQQSSRQSTRFSIEDLGVVDR